MRPLIAVTTTSYSGAEYRTPQVLLGAPYIEAVQRVSATPILLTPAHARASLAEVLDLVDGLLLTGGEDVDPSRYGQKPHPKLETVNHARDEMELQALERALELRMPVFAICRGIQLLNVHFGGTLFQDLPSEKPGGVIHEQTAPVNERWHGARVEPGSCLQKLFATDEFQINSFHHQGIDRLGEGLRAVAWADDGLVEAVEAIDYPWVVGVQWHPERGEVEIREDHRHPDWHLFAAFADEARAYREARAQVAGAGF
jgi:putative glutamine amidotransferase